MRVAHIVGSKVVSLAGLILAVLVVFSMTRTAFGLHTWFFRGVAMIVAIVAIWAASIYLRALVARSAPSGRTQQ